MHPPLEARCMFIDGPVCVTVSEAPQQEILDAYFRLERAVLIAARLLNETKELPCTSNQVGPAPPK